MKKIIALLMVASFAAFAAPPKRAPKDKRAAGGGRSSARRAKDAGSASIAASAAAATAQAAAPSSPVESAPVNPAGFSACMDSYCKSDMFPDKGRCRCSAQLGRIEKVLRDIDDAQNKADDMGRKLEIAMNAQNTAAVDGAMGSITDNIASIENKAKTMAGARIDARLNVAEGPALWNASLEKCTPKLGSTSEDEIMGRQKEYEVSVEKDCGAYTTILKEKADSVQMLLAQAQKNQEMFNEQEYKKRNQLDMATCRSEYEACMKTECGLNFHSCRENHLLESSMNKCDVMNKNKCEDHKATIMASLKEYVKKELRKDDIAMYCTQEGGNISEGRCMKNNAPLAARGWDANGYPTARDLKGSF